MNAYKVKHTSILLENVIIKSKNRNRAKSIGWKLAKQLGYVGARFVDFRVERAAEYDGYNLKEDKPYHPNVIERFAPGK